jgi:ribonuclease III family protein
LTFRFSGDAAIIHPRILAHLGDAVYELLVRERALNEGPQKLEDVHGYTTRRVNGGFQSQLLKALEGDLTEAEKDLIRRGRNQPVPVKRRSDHAVHRHASGFEALLGYLYLTDRDRLSVLWERIIPYLDAPESLG